MTYAAKIAQVHATAKQLRATAERAVVAMNYRADLLDRLARSVPGPDSKAFKLSDIQNIAEEWRVSRG